MNSALLKAMMKFAVTHNSDLGSLHSTAGLPIPNNSKEHTAFIFKGQGSCKNLAVAYFEVLLYLTEGTTENHGQQVKDSSKISTSTNHYWNRFSWLLTPAVLLYQ